MKPAPMLAAPILAGLLGLAACARSPLPTRIPEPASDDRAAALAAEQRANELEQALSASSAGEAPPDCRGVCELVDQICELSQRICRIAGRHRDDGDLADRCSAAERRCRRSRDRLPPGCSCQTR